MRTIKHIIVGVFLFLLWIPILQNTLHLFKGGELKGAYVVPADVTFSFETWFNGTYDSCKQSYLTSSFGLRPDIIRLYNQVLYWTAGKASSDNTVVGKENYLYEKMYINSYYGNDFIGEASIDERTTKIKQLQDTLSKLGIFLMVAYAPGKGSFYPEYFPDHMKTEMKPTNYEGYIRSSAAKGVNFVDLKAWFLAMKDTSRYKLFPRGGVHWSRYGEVMAFDSLVSYISHKTGTQLPHLNVLRNELSTKPRFRDYDAGDALNLITEFFEDTLAYPYYLLPADSQRKQNFLTIGCSYYWGMFADMSQYVFRECSFWYYFDNLYRSKNSTIPKNEANLKEIILQQNVICIMSNDAGLNNLGSGFVEEAHKVFFGN